jgi:hypothetical protein
MNFLVYKVCNYTGEHCMMKGVLLLFKEQKVTNFCLNGASLKEKER